jgi:hypothetical protein
MPAPPSQVQWYLARDGQQYGPLSEAELNKFVELGYSLPTDLLWREGFPDWRPAMVVFPQHRPAHPPQPAPSPSPALAAAQDAKARRIGQQQSRARTASAPPQHAGEDHLELRPDRRPRRGAFRKVVLTLLFFAALGAAAWFAYEHRAELMRLVRSMPTSITTAIPVGTFEAGDRKILETSPLKGFSGTPETVDAGLQTTALWRVIKRDFPDWYAERLKEAVAFANENKDETQIGLYVARALVNLRRQQIDRALSASAPRLKEMAAKFLHSVSQLQKDSAAACYALIAQGEASPAIVSLLLGSAHTAHLQAQMTSVFEGIAEGRKTPRVYPAVKREDFDLLASELKRRGWTQADWQLFTSNLPRAEPEKACQLMHDWFSAQLALTDSDAQLRLLVETLRVTFAG